MKYSLMSKDEKAKFAKGLANKLKLSLKGGGTAEQVVATVAQLVRTIGSSELVNAISSAVDENGQILDGGLREWLLADYSGMWPFSDAGDEADILNAFGYPADHALPWGTSEQELEAQSKGKLVGNSNFALFGNKGSTPQNIPEFTGEYYLWDEREGDIPDWWDMTGYTPQEPKTDPEKEPGFAGSKPYPEQGVKPAPAPAPAPAPITPPVVKPITAEEKLKELHNSIAQKEAERKLQALEAQKDLEARQIKQMEEARKRRVLLKQGYEGGVDQYDYDQAILKGTRLGDTDREGKFRLRSPEQVEARIREGQYNIRAPRRRAEANARSTIAGMKQWAHDTAGVSPKELEVLRKKSLRPDPGGDPFAQGKAQEEYKDATAKVEEAQATALPLSRGEMTSADAMKMAMTPRTPASTADSRAWFKRHAANRKPVYAPNPTVLTKETLNDPNITDEQKEALRKRLLAQSAR
jgi:hypothetical protein